MAAYLLSGVSGAGKTTIGDALALLGYKVINTDEALGYNGNVETGEPVERPTYADREWFKTNGWIWDGEKVDAIVRHAQSDVFLSGGSRNEAKFYDRFAKIFVIHASDEQLTARLRARNDPHTSSNIHVQRMIEMNQSAYEHAEQIGAVVIETSASVQQCVDQILAAIQD